MISGFVLAQNTTGRMFKVKIQELCLRHVTWMWRGTGHGFLHGTAKNHPTYFPSGCGDHPGS
jgi:hypothetical protein